MTRWNDEKVWMNDRVFEGIVSQEVRDQHGTVIPMAEVERAMPTYVQYGTLNDTHTNMVRGYPIGWRREGDRMRVRFGVLSRGENDEKFWSRVKNCGDKCGLSPGFDYTQELPGARLAGLTIFEISHLAPGKVPSNPGAWVTEVNAEARESCCGSCADGLGVCDDELDGVEAMLAERAGITGRPFGPWAGFDDCFSDPKMVERYPDDERRKKVCGALKARLEGRARAAEQIMFRIAPAGSQGSSTHASMSRIAEGTAMPGPGEQTPGAPAANNLEARVAAMEASMAEIKTLLQGMSGGRSAAPATPPAAAAPASAPAATPPATATAPTPAPVPPPAINATGEAALQLLTQAVTRMDQRTAAIEAALRNVAPAPAAAPAAPPAAPAAPTPQSRGAPSGPDSEHVPEFGFAEARKAKKSMFRLALGLDRIEKPHGAAGTPGGGVA